MTKKNVLLPTSSSCQKDLDQSRQIPPRAVLVIIPVVVGSKQQCQSLGKAAGVQLSVLELDCVPDACAIGTQTPPTTKVTDFVKENVRRSIDENY